VTERKLANVAASVRQRLLNRARHEGRPLQELATLYAMERFLFRLGRSSHADRFVLKGGLMTLTWAREYARVTRDIDLLGWGVNSVAAVAARMRDVVAVEVDDGVVFDAARVEASEITVEAAYVGVRVTCLGDLSGMRLHLQVDVGFGDVVVPAPDWIDYPQLLDLGVPRVLGYPPEATLAEKLHAIVVLGLTNSRMKDYYDLWTAARLGNTTPEGLGVAVRHTFARRGTPLPREVPEGLTEAFAANPAKLVQWAGFVRKSKLEAPPFAEVVDRAASLAVAAFEAASKG
jgi:hypothetical protein